MLGRSRQFSFIYMVIFKFLSNEYKKVRGIKVNFDTPPPPSIPLLLKIIVLCVGVKWQVLMIIGWDLNWVQTNS